MTQQRRWRRRLWAEGRRAIDAARLRRGRFLRLRFPEHGGRGHVAAANLESPWPVLEKTSPRGLASPKHAELAGRLFLWFFPRCSASVTRTLVREVRDDAENRRAMLAGARTSGRLYWKYRCFLKMRTRALRGRAERSPGVTKEATQERGGRKLADKLAERA